MIFAALAIVALILALIPYGRRVEALFVPLFSWIYHNAAIALIVAGALLVFFYYGRLHGALIAVTSPRTAALYTTGHALLSALGALAISCLVSLPSEFVHIVLYGPLAMCVAHLLQTARFLFWGRTLATLLFINVVSIIDEGLQGLHPERVFDPRDLLLNFAGGVIGLVLIEPFLYISYRKGITSGSYLPSPAGAQPNRPQFSAEHCR